MSTITKLAYDKTLAEMHNSNRINQNRRVELGGESPSLRSSSNGILYNDTSSDSESDTSSGNGSYGSIGNNRHSFISINEESSSPSALGVGYAFMSSVRGSKLLQEEDLAKLGDMPIDSMGGEAVSPHLSALMDRNINMRSPSLGKDKRMEYLNKIKNDFITGNSFAHPSTPPPNPPSSPPEMEESWVGKRVHRKSFALSQSSDALQFEEKDKNKDKDKDKDKDKEKDKDKDKVKMKKEEKERQKEEKLRKKQEKKEFKLRAKASTDPPNIVTAENSKIMQQLLGAMRPRATLTSRTGDMDEQLRRTIDSGNSSQKENALRRSTSFKEFDPTDDSSWRNQNRPKYEKILGTPVPDMDCIFSFHIIFISRTN